MARYIIEYLKPSRRTVNVSGIFRVTAPTGGYEAGSLTVDWEDLDAECWRLTRAGCIVQSLRYEGTVQMISAPPVQL
jgi:hypothetical protein